MNKVPVHNVNDPMPIGRYSIRTPLILMVFKVKSEFHSINGEDVDGFFVVRVWTNIGVYVREDLR